MSKKHKAKRKDRERRIIAALVNPQPQPIIIDGPDCDTQSIWRDHVGDYAAGWVEEDGQGWRYGGYL